MPLKKRSLVAVLLLVLAVASLGAPARVVAKRAGPLAFQEAPIQSTIVGRVWIDATADRAFNRGERPLRGVRVLLSQGGEVFNEAVTDGEDFYRFVGLEPGTYGVAVDEATLPPEYREGPPLSNVLELPGNAAFTQHFQIEEIREGRPSVTPSGVPSVRLDANPDVVTEGDSVIFTVTLGPSVEDVEYFYFFGDGRQERSAEPRAAHVYERPGLFQAFVQLAQNGDPFAESQQITVAVAPDEADPEPPPPVRMEIRVEPQSAAAGQPVVFTALGVPDNPAIEFRFHFGNAEPTDWSGEATAKHAYADPGAYEAFVEVRGIPNAPLPVASAPELVNVFPVVESGGGVPAWLLIVGLLLLVVVVGYVLWRRGKFIPPASELAVRPKPDTPPQVAPNHPLALSVEVRLRPVRDVGTHRVDAYGASIIQEEKRHAE